MHQESMKSLMIHSNWDRETQNSVGDDYLPSPKKIFGDGLTIIELQVNGQTINYSPFKQDIDRHIEKSSGLIKVYHINQVSGVKVLVRVINRRPRNVYTFRLMQQQIKSALQRRRLNESALA